MTVRGQRSDVRGQTISICLLASVICLLINGCGYTTRPGLASYLRTVYVKPFVNKIDLTQLATQYQQFPVYRHGIESDLTTEIINRFQFTGLMRPEGPDKADARLEGELIEFRRDALRFSSDKRVEEWRLNVVVNARLSDLHTNTVLWEEERLTGDTTYFAIGPNTESESTALARAITDLARRVVERTVENW